MPPKIQKKGRAAHISNPTTSGAQYAGKHSANGGGQKGVEGAQAPSQGVWGMCPHKFKRGGEPPTLATPPRVGPNTLANPRPTGVGKRGWRGRKPPGQVKPALSLSAKVPQHRNKTQKHRHVEIHPVNVKVVKKIVHSKVNKTPNCPYEQSPLPAHL